MDPLEGVEYVMDGLSAMLVDPKTANRARAQQLLLQRFLSLVDQPWPVARVHNALNELYIQHPRIADLLRAMTAFAGEDLPVAEHFIALARVVEEYRLTHDTDPLHDLDSKLPKNPTLADTRPLSYEETRQADKALGVDDPEGDAMLSGAAPSVHDIPLHVGKFFTDTLAKVLSPLMGRAGRSAEAQVEKDAESRAARAGLTALDKKMLELAKLAAAHPEQRAFLPMGDAGDWATALDDGEALARLPAPAKELFRALRAERNAREGLEAEELKRRDNTPPGRLLASVGRMRAVHDAGALSYGEVHLKYEAKTGDYTLAERVITLDATSALILKNPLEGGKEGAGLTTLRELIDSYIKKRKGADNWSRDGAFWKRRVIELRELDRPADGQPVDLTADGKRVPFDARAVTQLGYTVSEALGEAPPANDLLAFYRGLDSLMTDGSKIYLLDIPDGGTLDGVLRDKVISRYRDDGPTFGAMEKTRRYAQKYAAWENRGGWLLDALDELLGEMKEAVDPARGSPKDAAETLAGLRSIGVGTGTRKMSRAKLLARLKKQREKITALIGGKPEQVRSGGNASDDVLRLRAERSRLNERIAFLARRTPSALADMVESLMAEVYGEAGILPDDKLSLEALRDLETAKPKAAEAALQAARDAVTALVNITLKPLVKGTAFRRADALNADPRVTPTPLYERMDPDAAAPEEERDDAAWREWNNSRQKDPDDPSTEAEQAEAGQARYQASVSRVVETSTAVSGTPQNLPVPAGGVFGHKTSAAHKLVKKVLDALNLTGLSVRLYTQRERQVLEDYLYTNSPVVYQQFVARLERPEPVKAAVAFVNGQVLLYFDSSLRGAELVQAIGHELGHVVFRHLLDGERRRNTPIWNRLLDAYHDKSKGETFMEWFADRTAEWVKAGQKKPSSAVEAFFNRIVEAIREMLRALGISRSSGAVSAYLDGLALKEKEKAYEAYVAALQGEARYDLLTLQTTYHGANAQPRLMLDRNELDLWTPPQSWGQRAGQLRDWLGTFAGYRTARDVAKEVVRWGDDALSTANGWLRSQNIPELVLRADILDRGARESTVPLATDADIDALGVRGDWPAVHRSVRDGLKARAARLRQMPGVLGVALVDTQAQDGLRHTDVVPVYRESFTAAKKRLTDGVYGAGPEGYQRIEDELDKAMGEGNDPELGLRGLRSPAPSRPLRRPVAPRGRFRPRIGVTPRPAWARNSGGTRRRGFETAYGA